MPAEIIVTLDVMLARRKRRAKDLAAEIGMTEANLSLLKSGKVKGVRFDTLAKLCEALDCTPGDLLEVAATNPELGLPPATGRALGRRKP
ncbi:MAG: helix-turn-helix transcriptional regulator [Pseudomonadota bacterium]